VTLSLGAAAGAAAAPEPAKETHPRPPALSQASDNYQETPAYDRVPRPPSAAQPHHLSGDVGGGRASGKECASPAPAHGRRWGPCDAAQQPKRAAASERIWVGFRAALLVALIKRHRIWPGIETTAEARIRYCGG
jgi:hypothetical protein